MNSWLVFLALFGGLALLVLLMFARQCLIDFERYYDEVVAKAAGRLTPRE